MTKRLDLLACFFLVSAMGSANAQPASVTGGSGGTNSQVQSSKPYVVLVSFDGFGAQYLDRFTLPNFQRVMKRGVRAKSLQPVFPSITFPSHYSIATGLHVEKHGIVGMEFIDPARGQKFSYMTSTGTDGSWYRGEPIWVTAEKQGMVSATCMWPGSEAAIADVRPTYWKKYDGSMSDLARVQTVVDWLRLPAEQRPHLVTAYFSAVDSSGHRTGPDSDELAAEVQQADKTLGALLDGIDALPIRDQVALVVVSDHGMAKVTKDQTVPIDSLMDVSALKGRVRERR